MSECRNRFGNKRAPYRSWPFAAAFLLAFTGLTPQPSQAKMLRAETVSAFEQYVRLREAAMNQELAARKSFLWIDSLPADARKQAYSLLMQGQILTQRYEMSNAISPIVVPGGLIHEWFGLAFIPGVTLPQVMAILQDYDHDSGYYSPDVMKSRLVSRSGDDFKLFLRLKRVKIVSVVLDMDIDVHYSTLDSTHALSRSYSTRIAEVENAGSAQESLRPPGDDRGLLWRLDNYWRFYQADGGVYIQLDAISLTRAIPVGLGWLIRPFVTKVPSESMVFTLDATRRALRIDPE